MDTRNNKKDIKMFKDKLWTRRIHTEADVIVLRGNQVVEEITLLNKI